MSSLRTSQAPSAESGRAAARAARKQIEKALKSSDASQSHPERLHEAAAAAGADIVLMLPGADGDGITAVLRAKHSGGDSFLEVTSKGATFKVAEEPTIGEDILGFARASVEVLEYLQADKAIVAPLAAADR